MAQPSNPYAPPGSRVDHIPPARPVRPGFPWLLVLRWLIGLGVLISGLFSLYFLAMSWRLMADRAIIDPIYSPYQYLPVMLLKLATGVAILLRSKWSIALAAGWLAAFAYTLRGSFDWKHLDPSFAFSCMQVVAVFAFLCFLGLRGRLR